MIELLPTRLLVVILQVSSTLFPVGIYLVVWKIYCAQV